jgi:alanine racemase
MPIQSPLQWIELSRSALQKNISALSRLAGDAQLAASLKANAYGHGLPQMVQLLMADDNVSYLALHSLDEARVAREAGWQRHIMLVGPIATDQLEAIPELDVEPTVFDIETLEALGALSEKVGRPLRTHLKLETGTNRQGITEREIPAFAGVYQKYRFLSKPYGASMHFANIEDTTRHDYADFQLQTYNKLIKQLAAEGIKPTIRHTACSAAMILFEKTRFDLVRPGISVYGHWPSKETYLSYRLAGESNRIFEPVLRWHVRITQLKDVPADSFIGYGCTYRTTSATRLAILPVGYYDGYPRALSNQSYVLVKGRRAPVRGRICMNLMMIDVTDIEGVQLGDTATLIGSEGDERLIAEQLADWGQTIQYEILSRLSPAIERRIVD